MQLLKSMADVGQVRRLEGIIEQRDQRFVQRGAKPDERALQRLPVDLGRFELGETVEELPRIEPVGGAWSDAARAAGTLRGGGLRNPTAPQLGDVGVAQEAGALVRPKVDDEVDVRQRDRRLGRVRGDDDLGDARPNRVECEHLLLGGKLPN